MGVGQTIRSVRWRWVLLVGICVGVLTYVLFFAVNAICAMVVAIASGGETNEARLDAFASFAVFWGMPAWFLLLVAGVAARGVRKVGAPGALDGVTAGLVAAVAFQIVGRAFGPFSLREFLLFPLLGLLGGWFGSVAGRALLERQGALYRASKAIGSAESPREVARAIGEHLAGSGENGVTLWRIVPGAGGSADGGAPPLEPLASWAPRGEVWPTGRLDASRVPVLATLRRRSPRVVRGRELPPEERGAWGRLGVRSALLVPLGASGGGTDGLLVVASRRRWGFSGGRTQAFLTAGEGAALALENLRLVEEARYTGMLGERKRLAREIHDTLIQGFASIVMNLEAAEGSLENGSSEPDPATSRRHLGEARRTAREGLSEARRIVWALRPETLENAPLSEALGRLAGRWSEGDGATAEVNVTGNPRPLAPEAEVTLLRAAQEALTNVRKHAKAGRVVLTLSYMEDRVALDVLDDGVGFEPNGARASSDGDGGGFGLEAMRERVAQSGGTLLVESEPGKGTTLAIELPSGASGTEYQASGKGRDAEA